MAPNENEWKTIRFIVPATEVNIFTRYARRMTSFGIIMVATCASKVWGWRSEVIDENNYRGPRNKNGLPDHKKLQKENPADVVGFYCGLTCTMLRVFEIAEFYKELGVLTTAGGWHVHYCPEEALRNRIDVVVHGDGEVAIRQILDHLRDGKQIDGIPGISYLKNGLLRNCPPDFIELPDLDKFPYPDFGLLKYAKVKIYPIGRIRGCRMNCEFCSVKGRVRWASPEHLFRTVEWLVETRRAKKFFIVDDRLEEDLEGTVRFFNLVSSKYQDQLFFTVQTRLEVAKNPQFLIAMKKAGVRALCIGYESPIDEELKAMQKGYTSKHMIEWSWVLRELFWLHGMFIFGYPPKKQKEVQLTAKEREKRFKQFIRKAGIDSIQVLHPGPAPGSGLEKRLRKEGRIFPLELVALSEYDGTHACFIPDNMTMQELQEIPTRIMKWFYSPLSFWRIGLRTILFPIDYFIRGWKNWHRGWLRDVIKYGGHLLLQKWERKVREKKFLEGLEQYIKGIKLL